MRLYIDIETIPQGEKLDPLSMTPPANMSKKETIDNWYQTKAVEEVEKEYRKRALDPFLGGILMIGYAFGDEEPEVITCKDSLKCFYDIIEDRFPVREARHNLTWIGWNVDFDIQFMRIHAIKTGLDLRHIIPTSRYNDGKKRDLMAEFLLPAKGHLSLDKACEFLGMEGKGDIDGSLVYDYYLQDRIGEIAEYCKEDVRKCQIIDEVLR